MSDPDATNDPPRRARRSIRPVDRWAMVLGAAVVVLVVDQLSKAWALEQLSDGSAIDVVWTLRFKLAFNTGMAFSRGSGAGPIIGLVALGIVAVLLVIARKVESRAQLVVIGVVAGGAFGNIVDRLTRVGATNPFTGEVSSGFMSGAVVDFIDVQWWPVWNVADMAVVCGGIALAILSARVPTDGGSDAGEPDPADLPDQRGTTA
ncbi:MAG: signal peptidase II [Microthrixaceae bacterium]